MNQKDPKQSSKLKDDINPHSKSNTAFRKRHDISIKDFKRLVRPFDQQYA